MAEFLDLSRLSQIPSDIELKGLTSTTVDSFSALWPYIYEEIARFERCRDILALVGAVYISSKLLKMFYCVLRGVATYGISRYLPFHLSTTGNWAAVTGPTEGIGRAFALELAKQGMSVLLIGRNADTLRNLEECLQELHYCETRVIEIDFNSPGNAYDEIDRAFKDLDVGVVVNCAGRIPSHPMYLYELDDDDIYKTLEVNTYAVTKMTKIAVQNMMMKKKRGIVINVSSLSCFGPTPLLQVYAATKAYVTSFSRAVHEEVKKHGITVQTLTPSYVKTRMVGYSSFLSTSLLVPTPEVYVKSALGSVGYTTFTSGYWMHSLQVLFVSAIPCSLYMYMMRRINMYFRDEYLAHRN